MHLSNYVSDEKAIVYLATGLTFGTPCPEDTEDLSVERMRWQKAYELVLKGKITDSMTVAALLRFKILQMEKELNG